MESFIALVDYLGHYDTYNADLYSDHIHVGESPHFASTIRITVDMKRGEAFFDLSERGDVTVACRAIRTRDGRPGTHRRPARPKSTHSLLWQPQFKMSGIKGPVRPCVIMSGTSAQSVELVDVKCDEEDELDASPQFSLHFSNNPGPQFSVDGSTLRRELGLPPIFLDTKSTVVNRQRHSNPCTRAPAACKSLHPSARCMRDTA